jgi:hypothetical protein
MSSLGVPEGRRKRPRAGTSGKEKIDNSLPSWLSLGIVFQKWRRFGVKAGNGSTLRNSQGGCRTTVTSVDLMARKRGVAKACPQLVEGPGWADREGQNRASSRACASTGMGHGPGKPGRGPTQAGQPRRGDHAGRRFPSRNGHEPDGSDDPHPHRSCRFCPRQAGSDPRDVPLTIARRRPALHPQP